MMVATTSSLAILSLIIFRVHSEPWVKDGLLTSDEVYWVNREVKKADDVCAGDRDCKVRIVTAVRDVLNLRRALRRPYGSQLVFDTIRQTCDNLEGGIFVQKQCFEAIPIPNSTDEAMAAAGFRRYGVSRRGFNSLRTGMSLSEVEFILGDDNERVSYASSGGYSSSMYQWRAGTGMIVVTFSDYKLSAYSQFGLRP